MNYQDELRARLDAIQPAKPLDDKNKVTTKSLEEKLLAEIEDEFEFSQYDLEESDVLRSLKILDILKVYDVVFRNTDALKVFYTIAKVDIITAKNLYIFLDIDMKKFKNILKLMAKEKIIFQNNDNELELTLEGKSLASRLGIYIF